MIIDDQDTCALERPGILRHRLRHGSPDMVVPPGGLERKLGPISLRTRPGQQGHSTQTLETLSFLRSVATVGDGARDRMWSSGPAAAGSAAATSRGLVGRCPAWPAARLLARRAVDRLAKQIRVARVPSRLLDH